MAGIDIPQVTRVSLEKVASSPKLSTSALNEITSSESSGIPLRTPWTWWLDKTEKGLSAAEYEANIKKIYTITTVQSFWGVYNNILQPAHLETRHGYHMMRGHRRPLWEEEGNCKGGTWKLKISMADTNDAWRELLLAAIGEQFQDAMHSEDELIGVSVSIRDHMNIIQLWNARSDVVKHDQMEEKVRDVIRDLKLKAFFYKAHETHQAFEGGKSSR